MHNALLGKRARDHRVYSACSKSEMSQQHGETMNLWNRPASTLLRDTRKCRAMVLRPSRDVPAGRVQNRKRKRHQKHIHTISVPYDENEHIQRNDDVYERVLVLEQVVEHRAPLPA